MKFDQVLLTYRLTDGQHCSGTFIKYASARQNMGHNIIMLVVELKVSQCRVRISLERAAAVTDSQ